MPIHVVCPGCGRGINAADKYAGTSAMCPGCGAGIDVPLAASPPALPDVFDADEILAEARSASYTAPQGAAEVEDNIAGPLLRTLVNELREGRKQLDEVIKHTKRTGQWVAFWSILALLPFFFWVFVFLAGLAAGISH